MGKNAQENGDAVFKSEEQDGDVVYSSDTVTESEVRIFPRIVRTKIILFLGILGTVLLFSTFPLWAHHIKKDNSPEAGTSAAAAASTAVEAEAEAAAAGTDLDPGLEKQLVDETAPIKKSNSTGGATTQDIVSNLNHLNILQAKAQKVNIAWIMSFGGSGTSYTLINTEHVTGTTTATNYGRDLDPCLPVHYDSPDGPFLHSLQLDVPPANAYIMTKTHCGGYCMDCAPGSYVLTPESFEEACRTGHRPATDKDEEDVWVETTYADTIPKKAVHLLRNPFDNLVGRMHLAAQKHHSSRVDDRRLDEEELDDMNETTWNSTKEGFATYCLDLDSKYTSREHNSALLNHSFWNSYKNLPCHAEWFRYFQWHNLALQAQEKLKLPTYFLFYHNYTEHYNETVDALLGFLDLPVKPQNTPVEFISGKNYSDYFDEEAAILATRMAKEMASPKLWSLIGHWFTPWINKIDTLPQADVAAAAVNSNTTNATRDHAGVAEQNNAPVLSVNYDYGSTKAQVAWLMSFPNSGTSFTMMNTLKTTNKTTASNYAGDWDFCIPVRPELDNGPFIERLDMSLPSTVLTKTHCAAYCDDCGPKSYRISEAEFARGCGSGEYNKNGEILKSTYDASIVKKAIHLVRNPFDNIVARYHLALDKRQKTGTRAEINAIANFSGYCNYLDTKYAKEELAMEDLTSHQKGLLNDVPCHAEWYRYVQWHNMAMQVTKNMSIPVQFLFYEDYAKDFNGTVQKTLVFLGVSAVSPSLAFQSGHSYPELFDTQVSRAAKRLVQTFASADTWDIIGKYFDGISA